MSAQYGFMTQRLHRARRTTAAGWPRSWPERIRGTANVLEAEYGGFCSSFAGGTAIPSGSREAGGKFRNPNVGLRPYACAGSACTTVDAVKTLREREKMSADGVREIVVPCNESIYHHCGWEYKPDTVITAQFSIQYAAAVTLLEGTPRSTSTRRKRSGTAGPGDGPQNPGPP